MRQLDDQLKELKELPREESARMTSYHQAKAQLYKREKPERSRMLGKKLGIPIAFVSVLFIGFILSYQWFGDHWFGTPLPADEQEEVFIESDIREARVGNNLWATIHGADGNEIIQDYIVVDDTDTLAKLKDDLNGKREAVEVNSFDGYDVELLLESGDTLRLSFSNETEEGGTVVNIVDEGTLYQYDEDLNYVFMEYLAGQSYTNYYSNIEEALAEIAHALHHPGESPMNLTAETIVVMGNRGTGREIFQIDYVDAADEVALTYVAHHSDEELFTMDQMFEDEIDVTKTEYKDRTFYTTEMNASIIMEWQDGNVYYSLTSESLSMEELLDITDIMYGTEEEGEVIESGDREEQPETNIDPLDKYAVFTNYDLEHQSYMSEAKDFYFSEASDYILGFGHQAHAVIQYRLYEVNDDGTKVTAVRSTFDSEHEVAAEQFVAAEDWEGLITFLLENGEAIEEVFFEYDENRTEETVTVDGETLNLYPVPVNEDLTYYFKEGQGLWMVVNENEAAKELFGENNYALRKIEE
ncbi:DUF4367 domain-containing protein [Evansella cellulosilytica]|uniref:Uncharacterized protein n=1 Tax=Evansella cellulosilytica (strain ATCC 21833 / DSM 2522 / FERM P-1141 / JCM 9156 / N-4) TaxID=649639 RepID=E6TXD8_EVAC2|nr:DUF4367 domain-containing protein [Evansella cellulosilytica]ADU32333.1 hypothetical protein Bcell_4105 [Evansella cellulosilytica DSM 2522]